MSTANRFSFHCGFILSWLAIAYCQLSYAADQKVQPATYNAEQSLPRSEGEVRFSQQPSQVGDRVWQQTSIEMNLQTTITQSGQIANQDSSSIHRQQQRLIEVLELAEGHVRRARVSYAKSRLQSPESTNPSQVQKQPVEGKSYLVARQDKQLIVTDEEGFIPPQSEFEIVFGCVQTLGLPNPLAEFLTSRTFQVGDRLKVPRHIAEEVMGFGEQFGRVQSFELELTEVLPFDGERCARFLARIQYQGSRDLPLAVAVAGELVIQTETSRTIAANLAGPLHMTAAEPNLRYSAKGELQAAIQSRYVRVRK